RSWEFSPPYYNSQLGDSLIISRSFGFGNFHIIYAWALDFKDGIISSCNLLFTIPHPAVHFLKLFGFSNANKPIVEAEIVQQWSVQQARLLKEKVFILEPDGVLMSTQQYMDKVVEDVGDDDDFKSAAWVSATKYVNTFCGTITGCFGDVQYLEQYIKVIGKGGYGKDISVGTAMILTNVSVFSPNPSKHYLNITMRNVVEVFRKDIVLGNGGG
nr:hypothetical protein [Tanacetum cinerariifolium]